MPKASSGSSKNMSGGKEAAKQSKLEKKATSSKGRGKQPRGSAKAKARPQTQEADMEKMYF